MLENNTMTHGTDKFVFRKQSLLKAADPWDFTYETSVGNFIIEGTQPDETNRRIIFEMENKLYKFGNDGLTAYDDRGELADILINGNTVGELLDVKEVPQFIGKKVYPIIALDAPIDAPIMPKIKIAVNVKTYNDIYTRVDYSPIYKLEYSGQAAKIEKITCAKTLKGYATAEIHCRLKNRFGNWQDWIELDDAKYKEATAIQYRVKYILTTLDGTDEITINDIKVDYTPDVDRNVGTVTEIVTTAQEYSADFGICYALIKHSELQDAQIKAFVNFRALAVERADIRLGDCDGSEQTFTLGIEGVPDKNIDQSTLHLYLDGVGIYDFHYNTAESTVTLKAPAGKTLTARYNCDIAAEDWQEMAKDFTELDGDHFNSRFTYQLDDYEGKKISAVKFQIIRTNETPEVFEYIVGWTPHI